VLPAAKAAVTHLRQRIAALVDGERQTALSAVSEHEAKLRELPDFAALPEQAQSRVLLKGEEARAALAAARFVTAIRDRLSRYRTQDYPAQLALISQLATPPPEPQGGGSGATEPTPPSPTYVPASSLRAKCSLPYLSSVEDIDQWIAALRQAALNELADGHRISL
jgi:hypothetical protein